MAKVKKRVGVTSGRNVKATKKQSVRSRSARKIAAPRRKVLARNSPTRAKKPVRKGVVAKKLLVKGKRLGSQGGARTQPRGIVVKALDPQQMCGPGTTVQLLYRVDETVEGRSTPHLVFFDRHGWYCEHGRACPAVGHARKHKGHIARAS